MCRVVFPVGRESKTEGESGVDRRPIERESAWSTVAVRFPVDPI
jgi:hypothetical protein